MATSPPRIPRSTVVITVLTVGVFGAGTGLGSMLHRHRQPAPAQEVLRLVAGTYQLDLPVGAAVKAPSLTGADSGSVLSGGGEAVPVCLGATVGWRAVAVDGGACAAMPMLGASPDLAPPARPGNPKESSTPSAKPDTPRKTAPPTTKKDGKPTPQPTVKHDSQPPVRHTPKPRPTPQQTTAPDKPAPKKSTKPTSDGKPSPSVVPVTPTAVRSWNITPWPETRNRQEPPGRSPTPEARDRREPPGRTPNPTPSTSQRAPSPTVTPSEDRPCVIPGPSGEPLRPALRSRADSRCPTVFPVPTVTVPASPSGEPYESAVPSPSGPATPSPTAHDEANRLRPGSPEGDVLPVFRDPALLRRAEEALGLDGSRSYVDENGQWDLTIAPPGTPECRDYSDAELRRLGLSREDLARSPSALPRDSCLWPAFIRWLYAEPAEGEVSNWTKFTGLPDRSMRLVVVDPPGSASADTTPGEVDGS
ncbi:hypothetical protein [Thermoactinospora rubra]|uniref:hypothetical protein n=1 Tax=Thermoactinospora rubra TaxID=1088767 RepID=UPI00117F53EF|nr:hypothetical protein [Thermoactinospora rubra]